MVAIQILLKTFINHKIALMPQCKKYNLSTIYIPLCLNQNKTSTTLLLKGIFSGKLLPRNTSTPLIQFT